MKRVILISGSLAVAISLIGCVRTTTYVKERVDQGIAGNRGYLQGPPPGLKQSAMKPRKILNLEIELPPYSTWERHEWQDNQLWGNRGYIVGKPH